MGIALFGPNRMVNWQAANRSFANRDLTESKPEWGLGPTGMPGSSDYLADAAGRARRDKGPNAFELMGLYWNGSGISQGRPLRDIQLDQSLAPLKMAQGDRQLDLSAAEQAQRGAAEQSRLGLMASEQDMTRGKLVADQAAEQARLGLMADEQAMQRARIASDAGLGLRRAAVDEAQVGIAKLRENTGAVQTLANIAPNGQRAAAALLGIAPPATPLVSAGQLRATPDALALWMQKEPALMDVVTRAARIDPKAPDADAQYARIGAEGGLKKTSFWHPTRSMARQVRDLVQAYGPAVEADRMQRLGPGGLFPASGAGKAGGKVSNPAADAVSDDDLKEYVSTHPQARAVPREQLRAMLAAHLANLSAGQ
ncbi:MAG: hypothetical protein WCR06_01650 [bacterium]